MPYRVTLTRVDGRMVKADFQIDEKTPSKGDTIEPLCDGLKVRAEATKVTRQPFVDRVEAKEL